MKDMEVKNEVKNEMKRVNLILDEIYVHVKDVDFSISEETFNEDFEDSSIADIRDEMYKMYCRLRDIDLIIKKHRNIG